MTQLIQFLCFYFTILLGEYEEMMGKIWKKYAKGSIAWLSFYEILVKFQHQIWETLISNLKEHEAIMDFL